MVSLEGINRWADELGRDIENDPDTTDQVDLTRDEFQGRERSDAGAAEDVGSGVPEGTMLVPLDAWNKMLNQLGNLHEAGQQLAEARERAAKAETEATFLRERLSDMRAQLEEARAAEDEAPETETERPSSGKADQQRDAELSVSRFTKAKAKQLYRRWRTR